MLHWNHGTNENGIRLVVPESGDLCGSGLVTMVDWIRGRFIRIVQVWIQCRNIETI